MCKTPMTPKALKQDSQDSQTRLKIKNIKQDYKARLKTKLQGQIMTLRKPDFKSLIVFLTTHFQ